MSRFLCQRNAIFDELPPRPQQTPFGRPLVASIRYEIYLIYYRSLRDRRRHVVLEDVKPYRGSMSVATDLPLQREWVKYGRR